MTKSCRIAAVLALILVAVPASAQTRRLTGVKFTANADSAVAKPPAPPRVRQAEEDDENLQISGFVGIALDTFAATELKKYLNPEDVGGVTERHVVGINFDYRLWKSGHGQELWLYGETVNGVRSSDVDCKADPSIPVCKGPFEEPGPEAALFALRNATSLEAFVGARIHLLEVNKRDPKGKTNDGPSADIYFKAQAGFLTVADNGSDVIDLRHVGLGLMLNGRRGFGGSYLEVGYGRNDLFTQNARGRLKIDGFLTMGLSEDANVRPFIQMTVDADGGSGADSIQIYLGLDLSLDKIFKKQQ
jgi:hypothetical protein